MRGDAVPRSRWARGGGREEPRLSRDLVFDDGRAAALAPAHVGHYAHDEPLRDCHPSRHIFAVRFLADGLAPYACLEASESVPQDEGARRRSPWQCVKSIAMRRGSIHIDQEADTTAGGRDDVIGFAD